jgi:deoxyribose-phosphate aldolase
MNRQEEQLDRLVDVITKRVEAELEKRARPAAPVEKVAHCGACDARGSCEPKKVLTAINAGAIRLGASPGVEAAPCSHVAPLIDHTILKPEATREELRQVAEEARQYGFATVCVNSANVRFVASILEGSSTKAIAVVGFPTGAATTSAKAFETREAIRAGAQEIDMVINIGALKSKDYAFVAADIRGVVEAAGRVPVKVILETSKLERDEKVIACALSKASGAAFVKTSTGFGGGGATAEDIELMRSIVGDDIGVKASGGVRTIDDVERMVAAGADRIGASSSVAIVKCERGKDSGGAKPKGY